jgi:hypothetical protein
MASNSKGFGAFFMGPIVVANAEAIREHTPHDN